jgi:methionyl-tRNA synthetase
MDKKFSSKIPITARSADSADQNRRFYITTSIPYVNGAPHVGHSLEFVQADALARYYRSLGYDTYFLSGSDDNALKNVQAAEKANQSTQEFVDQHAQEFADLKHVLNISYDQFIRTASPYHFKGAQALWSRCKKEDLYKKSYKGLYCVGCEQFYSSEELLEGNICPDHLKPVEEVEEENWFFKLSNYQDELRELISSDELKIYPESRKNEMLSFINQGLQDFSVSRSVSRAKGWGVPVPNDDTQIMYVWFDALANYITALGFGQEDDTLFKKYWPADIHAIGKGINRFHTIYWPAMLLSARLATPKSVTVHGYLTVNGQKIGKSLGNAIHPQEIVDKYGRDAVRYYFLREIPTYADADFSDSRMLEIYSADLANGLGNLVSRTHAMIIKYADGKIPALPKINLSQETDNPIDEAIRQLGLACIQNDPSTSQFAKTMEQRELNKAIEIIWDQIKQCDQLINITEPWKLAKNGETEKVHQILFWLSQAIHNIAWQIQPFLPETAVKIAKAYNIEKLLVDNPNMFHGIHEWNDEVELGELEQLFPRLA